jgi:glyoxylase-like metal-dependent hydrolase (beta-lactamase superfamily II)
MNIFRIETGKVKVKQNQLKKSYGMAPRLAKVFFDPHWSEWLPIYAWVIDHHEGLIVVDTGETHKTSVKGYLPKWHPYYSMAVEFDVRPEEEIGPRLKKLGINPAKDVSKVIMTHLHTDHAGGMYHFPNAEFLIEEHEYQVASGISGIMAGYLPHRWPKWLSPTRLRVPDNSFGPFTRSLSVTKDEKVQIVMTPGHVASHLSVVVEMDGLHYFIAGDASYTQDNMINLVPDGVGTADSIDTLKNIRAFASQYPTLYLPSHDPDVPRRMKEKDIVPVLNQIPVK